MSGTGNNPSNATRTSQKLPIRNGQQAVFGIAFPVAPCVQGRSLCRYPRNGAKPLIDRMTKRLAKFILMTLCIGAIVACKPKPPPPDISSETAAVEEKLKKFKAEPTRATMEAVDKELENLSAKIKELEARESQVSGAEKDKLLGKLSALRTKYNLYTVEVAAMKVQAVADRAVEKAGDAVEKAGDAIKDAADSVTESLKSTNN
jgi:hypothetical protein